jgi:hypothetical protein
MIAGIPEVVEDGASGILVPPNDDNVRATAMIGLTADYGLGSRSGY